MAFGIEKRLTPSTLTILLTYRCNAACEQCCFESNPSIREQLNENEVLNAIKEAKNTFPELQLVCFSGGEAFLLKKTLYSALQLCSELNLKSRIVTNAFWARDMRKASETVEQLKSLNLTEINISTGVDHQKWVHEDAVVNAAEALLDVNLTTLITVEVDTTESGRFKSLESKLSQKSLLNHPKLTVQSNSWMPFQSDAKERDFEATKESLRIPCSQVFENIVITPHNMLSACCGLTLEHIPEMKLGDLRKESIRELYDIQLDDFLKHWIRAEGPYSIIETLMGEDYVDNELPKITHICQACVFLHKTPEIKEALFKQYLTHVPRIMSKFILTSKEGSV
ncbi:radical SAM protein [Idiomarina baltica]|uniref:radical SAM protein n=1 Tax=Idiomarina baltica TaxID=190892 RepID=UPI002FDE1FBC